MSATGDSVVMELTKAVKALTKVVAELTESLIEAKDKR